MSKLLKSIFVDKKSVLSLLEENQMTVANLMTLVAQSQSRRETVHKLIELINEQNSINISEFILKEICKNFYVENMSVYEIGKLHNLSKPIVKKLLGGKLCVEQKERALAVEVCRYYYLQGNSKAATERYFFMSPARVTNLLRNRYEEDVNALIKESGLKRVYNLSDVRRKVVQNGK